MTIELGNYEVAADDASDAIRDAKRILLEHRVQQFSAADVVALAALILQREDWYADRGDNQA